MKIANLKLQNFRGVRAPLSVDLENFRSLLIYGDNGTGKSSFLDGIEWFITDNVSHLGGEEIEKHGGLRNALAESSEECFVSITFSDKIEIRKTLNLVKDKLKAEFEPTDENFKSELLKLSNERLWIRNKDLIEFIIKRKKDRLENISDIIGYNDVVKMKATLKKAANDIKGIIRTKNFEGQIAQKKSLIATKINATVNNDTQFFQAVNTLISPLLPTITVESPATFKQAIEQLKSSVDSIKIAERQSLEQVSKISLELQGNIQAVFDQISELKDRIKKVNEDKETAKNISLAKLYEEASKVLASHEKDDCPLCESQFDRNTLKLLISEKILKLKEYQKTIQDLDLEKIKTQNALRDFYSELKGIIKSAEPLKGKINSSLTVIQKEIEKNEAIGKSLAPNIRSINVNDLVFDTKNLSATLVALKESVTKDLGEVKDDKSASTIDLIGKLSVAEQALNEFLMLGKERIILDKQFDSLEKIASDFNSTYRNEMKNFLSAISNDLDKFYLFMNDGEKIDQIELVTVDDSNGEFAGIAMKLKFHGQEINSPKKFLSESHVNCLGLCLFLASVKLFNIKSKFFVLDDVISSFDKNHRLRFGQLLLEKFKDYQIILFTHETEWYEFMVSQVKGKGWRINSTKWNPEVGTDLDFTSPELEDRINAKISNSDESGLGNLIRKYAERLIKELSNELNAEFPFRFNDRNENRTLDELLSGFRSRLNKKTDLGNNEVINRMAGSQFFANKSSHDSRYSENLADLRPIYKDLQSFKGLFCCGECHKYVSLLNHNKSKKVLSCRCGELEIGWKD